MDFYIELMNRLDEIKEQLRSHPYPLTRLDIPLLSERDAIERCLEEAGLGEHITPHD
jgi:hypothetical protein